MAFSATSPGINAADVNTVHSMMTAITFIRGQSLAGLCSRAFEGDLANARSTVIHLPNLSATVPASRGRNDAYDNRSELGATQIKHEIDQHYESGFKISYIDEIEVPWATVAQAEEAMTANMAKQIDDQIWAYIAALTTKTLTSKTLAFAAGDTTKEDGSGDNGNAGKVGLFSYGSDNNDIPATGVPESNTARGYIYQFLNDVLLRFRRRNVSMGVNIGGDARYNEVFAVFPPELVDVLVDDMAAKNYHWDELTSTIVRNRAILETAQYTGAVNGIRVFASNAIPAPTESKTTAKWKFFAGTPAALLLSIRPQLRAMWDATTNQTEPYRESNLICDFGIDLLNRELLIMGSINTASS